MAKKKQEPVAQDPEAANRAKLIEKLEAMKEGGEFEYVRPMGYWKGNESGFSGYFPIIFRNGMSIRSALLRPDGTRFFNCLEYVRSVFEADNNIPDKLYDTPEKAMDAWRNGRRGVEGTTELERVA